MNDDGMLMLRNAIIEQAVEDYKTGFVDPEGRTKTSGRGYASNKDLQQDAESFLRGSWCAGLLSMDDADVTGDFIIRKIREYTFNDLVSTVKEKKAMKVTLIQQTEKPIEFISKIASICYDSHPTNKQAMVKHLYMNGHHSPFEHVYFTFKIEGISRACSHQLVRHRLAAITQRSQRYCEENAFEYVTPYDIKLGGSTKEKYEDLMQDINKLYCEMIHLCDVKKEDARFLLPNACTTEMYFSCNLRELIHIANERLCSRAQWEIREVVQKMVDLVDPDLKWMLVPKCESGVMICNKPCKGQGYKVFDWKEKGNEL